MATNASQVNTAHITQLLLLNLGSRNACMRALVAHPTDLNAAANWLINHRNDANIDTDPFATQPTNTRTTAPTNTNTTNTYTANRFQPQAPQQHTQQHMIQQVMNLGYTRDEALRAYTNVATTDRNQTNKLVDYLVKNPKKEDKKSTYNTYSNNSSYYPYSSSNKKKVYRPVINIDDIKVEKEEICAIDDCDCLEHIGIILREYKAFLNKSANAGSDHKCDKGKDYENNGFYAYFLDKISGDGEYTLSDVMDDFIHLITKHDVRYGEFNKVYQYIIGKDAMNGKITNASFDLLKRIICCNNSLTKDERNALYFGFESVKEITIQQLCDRMYCYLVVSGEIGAKLSVDKYEKLDKQYEIPPRETHKETGKVKEKSIGDYIGMKEYRAYSVLLEKERETWLKYDKNKLNKFNTAFTVEQLETRIDPKVLKTELGRQRKEKKRKERETKRIENERLQALKDKENEQKAKESTEDKVKDDSKDKTEDTDTDKDKDKTEPKKEDANQATDAPKAAEVKEEKKEEKKEDSNANASVAQPNVLPKVIEKKEDKKEFSFGVRYNYWASDMEDLIGITINKKDAKYKSLKAELIGNGLSAFEYDILSEKAEIYFNTEFCQDTIEAGVNPFGIRLLDKITRDHIISVMIYCNYAHIRTPFVGTYIRQKGETNTDMMERHSHFYYLGRYLRESIECYGEEAHRSETKVFYHGINMSKDIMSDDSIKALFVYPPLSTTSQMEICLNDSPELVMELKGYVSKYFDCAWLSDLCFEKEQIFCGGTRALTVNRCIDCVFGYDHKLFIDSMKYVPNIFKSNVSDWKVNKNDDMLQETKETIRNLLYYQLNKNARMNEEKGMEFPENLGGKDGIPSDIEEALDKLCTSTTGVRMHYDAMYNHRAYGFLSSLFMTPTRTFAKLDVIEGLFPKINTFSMISTPLTTLTFMYIKSYINPNFMSSVAEEEKDDHKEGATADMNKTRILEIRLIDPKTAAMSIEQVIQAERKSLAQLQWTIDSPDQMSLLLKWSDSPVIIKEPTPPPVVVEKKEEKKEEAQEGKKKLVRRKKKRRPPGQGKPRPKGKAKPKAESDKTDESVPAKAKTDVEDTVVSTENESKPKEVEQQK